jgi:hypothetical protein
MVMIRCPGTGKAMPTGYAMDRPTFDSNEVFDIQTKCIHCGRVHRWTKRDAWVHDERPWNTAPQPRKNGTAKA